ncbi:MAG: patatin-like phospholipase family protein [Proteobacteria bacterium]|nr:patatin-like phospholipase family protein [Pseudomonadota bacterium]
MPESASIEPQVAAQATVKKVNLALQGGGAHGAFTWGVLDRLLEDDRLAIEGISGTSAGAMNGAVLAYGMMEGGRDGARRLLRDFWKRVADQARFSIFQPTLFDRLLGNRNLDFSWAFQAFDLMTRVLSPYQYNPRDVNPLRDVLGGFIDFDRLRRYDGIKLFVSATNVRSGKIKVFGPAELSLDVLLASACLPHMFRAIEIDGEHYWDGGYMGNPAMFPLIYNCRSSDIMLVEVNPIRIEEVPTTARAIIDRVNDISFNATMMREMRAISLVTWLIDQHRLTGKTQLRRIHFHMVQAQEEMEHYGVSSKFNCDWDFLLDLHRLGRQIAEKWLQQNFDKIGTDSSVDLHNLFF